MGTGFGRFKNSREYCILDLLWSRKYSVEQRDGTIKRRMQGRLTQNKYHINKLGKKFRYLYTRCWWYIIVAKNRKKNDNHIWVMILTVLYFSQLLKNIIKLECGKISFLFLFWIFSLYQILPTGGKVNYPEISV